MALAVSKTYVAAEVLFASDLNLSLTTIHNNALALISPLTGNLDAGSNDITALDEVAFTDAATGATVAGRLRRNGLALNWHDGAGSAALMPLARGYLSGLTLVNSGTDPTNDVDIAVGVAVNSTAAALMRLTAALTKQLDAAWAVGTNAGGLDTGSIANTTYHVHLIQRVDTGVVDVLFSTSATAPTMPTSYTLFRRIGSFIRAGGAITLFRQLGDEFLLNVPVTDVDTTNPGTAAVTAALASVPAGVQFRAILTLWMSDATPVGSSVLVTALDQADTAPAVRLAHQSTGTGDQNPETTLVVRTDTSRQVRYRCSGSDASFRISFTTHGWYDTRGRDL